MVHVSVPPAPTKNPAKISGMDFSDIPYIKSAMLMGRARGGVRLATVWHGYFSVAMYVVLAPNQAVRIKIRAMITAMAGLLTLSTVLGIATVPFVTSGARLVTPWLSHFSVGSLCVAHAPKELPRRTRPVLDKVPVRISATVS